MQVMAQIVSKLLPPKWGFVVLAFPLEGREGLLNYVSNAERESIVKTMKEFIAKTEGNWGEHTEG